MATKGEAINNSNNTIIINGDNNIVIIIIKITSYHFTLSLPYIFYLGSFPTNSILPFNCLIIALILFGVYSYKQL